MPSLSALAASLHTYAPQRTQHTNWPTAHTQCGPCVAAKIRPPPGHLVCPKTVVELTLRLHTRHSTLPSVRRGRDHQTAPHTARDTTRRHNKLSTIPALVPT